MKKTRIVRLIALLLVAGIIIGNLQLYNNNVAFADIVESTTQEVFFDVESSEDVSTDTVEDPELVTTEVTTTATTEVIESVEQDVSSEEITTEAVTESSTESKAESSTEEDDMRETADEKQQESSNVVSEDSTEETTESTEETAESNTDKSTIGETLIVKTDEIIEITKNALAQSTKLEYNITSQEEWDNIWKGITDSNFSGYLYNGTPEVFFTLNCDITSTIIQCGTDSGKIIVNLNNHKLTTVGTNPFITGTSAGGIVVKNGTIDGSSNTNYGCLIVNSSIVSLDNITIVSKLTVASATNCTLSNVDSTYDIILNSCKDFTLNNIIANSLQVNGGENFIVNNIGVNNVYINGSAGFCEVSEIAAQSATFQSVEGLVLDSLSDCEYLSLNSCDNPIVKNSAVITANTAITARGCKGLTIKDTVLTNTSSTNAHYSIDGQNGTGGDVILDNVESNGFKQGMIFINSGYNSLDIKDCKFVGTANTYEDYYAVALALYSMSCSTVNILDCSFEKFKTGIAFTDGSMTSSGHRNAVVKGCDFADCCFGINLSAYNGATSTSAELKIESCNFTNSTPADYSDYKNTAIYGKTCIAYKSLDISDVNISDYGVGIMIINPNTVGSISGCIITGCYRGIDTGYGLIPTTSSPVGSQISITDCDIEGRKRHTTITAADDVNRTYGIFSAGERGNTSNSAVFSPYFTGWDSYLSSRKDIISNVRISNCDIGIGSSSLCYVKDSTITNVSTGLSNRHYTIGNWGSFWVDTCTIKSGERLNDWSFGVLGGGNGVVLLNSTVEGFKFGTHTMGTHSNVFGSIINNCDTGIYASTANIYSTKVSNVQYGCLSSAHDMYIVNSIIEGNGKEGSFGVSAANSVYESTPTPVTGCNFYVVDYAKNPTYAYVNARSMFSNCRSLDYFHLLSKVKNPITQKTTIRNFETGMQGNSLYLYGVDIEDCTYGIHCKTGQYGNYVYFYKNNEIHDCAYGIYENREGSRDYALLNIDFYNVNADEKSNTNLEVYNCTNGITSADGLVGISLAKGYWNNPGGMQCLASLDNKFNLVLYNNENAMLLNKHYTDLSVQAYDNTKGITIGGNSPDNCVLNLNLTNNADYNLYIKENASVNIGTSIVKPTITTNGAINNINVLIDGKVQLYTTELNTSEATYYLMDDYTADSGYIHFIDEPESVHGVLTFDTLDEYYYEDRIVAVTPTSNYANSLVSAGNVAAKKKGWVVQSDNSNLVLKEGITVTYDYVTNGGDSFSEENNTKIVLKGKKVDLSPTASKDGYEFVGWSLKKNSTEVLEQNTDYLSLVTEGFIEDVTLYAVYKTTTEITYHTFDGKAFKSIEPIYIYNNNTSVIALLEENTEVLPNRLTFIGYSLNKTKYSEVLIKGSSVEVPLEGLDVWCIYDSKGSLFYKDIFGHIIDTDRSDYRFVGEESVATYNYMVKDYVARSGYQFNGWIAEDKKDLVLAGSNYETNQQLAVLIVMETPIISKSLEVTPEKAKLEIGETQDLIATILPENTFNKNVEWYSENINVATVDQNGTVTAINTGVVKVYAKTTDGSNLTDYSIITVVKTEDRIVTVQGVLKTTSGNLVKNKKISLISDDNKYWTQTDEKGEFVFKKVRVGEYLFTVYDNDDSIIAQCQVNVAAPDSSSSDSVDILNADDYTSVDYNISGDLFIINVDIDDPDKPDVKAPETGDYTYVVIFILFGSLFMYGWCLYERHKIK